jgi:RHS repeat-associated protein
MFNLIRPRKGFGVSAVRRPFASVALAYFLCLVFGCVCGSAFAQTVNWNGTWSGRWNATQINAAGGCTIQNGGNVVMDLSIVSGSVTGTAVLYGITCYYISSCATIDSDTAAGEVSGTVTSNTISLNFDGSIVQGACAGSGITWSFTGTLTGNVITGNGTVSLSGGAGSGSITLTGLQPYKSSGKPGNAPGASVAGEPISVGTGNMYEEVRDYSTAGANPLAFTRYYNSLSDANTQAQMLGRNWRSTYDRYLDIGTYVTAERPDGEELIFTFNGTNWVSDSDVSVQLSQTGPMWTLIDSDDTIETYDTSGQLTSIQARNGYKQTLQYNGGNQLESVSDSFGRMLLLGYQSNLLHTVTAPNGLVFTYGYNSSGLVPGVPDRLVSVTYSTTPQTSQSCLYTNTSLPFALTGIIDEDGNLFTSWMYDSSGRALLSQFANGANLVTVGYDDIDGSRQVTNSLGSVMAYEFTTLQGVPKVTEIDRLASVSVSTAINIFTYDDNGFQASSTDWNTNLSAEASDYRGLPLTNEEAVGTMQERTTTNIWHQTFHLPLQIAEPGKITTFTYDGNGNMLTRTETDTSTNSMPYSTTGRTRAWSNTFGSFGHLLTATGPRTDVVATTSFTYDTNGNVSTVTDALGHVTTLTNYTGSGLPLTMIDPNNVVTSFTYDPRDRLLSRTVHAASGNAETMLGYDPAGNITSITLPDGSFLGYQYDAAHRLQSVSNSLGESINFRLDAAGDIVRQNIEAADGALVKTQGGLFDQLGRMLQQVGAYAETTTYGYDSDDNRISVTDALTNKTTSAFDALNRLISVIDPLTNVIGLGYDPQDNLTAVTDPRSLITSYVYDGFRHVIQETSPDKGTTVYMLDKAGNRTNETDARGVVTLRTFDALNRVTSETFPASPGENITYTYDSTAGGNFGIGRLTEHTDETGSTTLVYNERGDVVNTTRVIGGIAYTTAYGYDLADHVISITYPSGDTVGYMRDSQGRIKSVSYQPSGSGVVTVLATNVTYMPFGPLSGLVYGNGLARTQNYDLDYRLTNITTFASGANVQSLSLGYDAVNDIRSITDNLDATRSQTFAYDPDCRLTGAGGIYGTLGYTYDPDGNRLTQTANGVTQSYTYSHAANMLRSVVGSGVARLLDYTPNGNLSSDNRGTATNLVFNYGNRNRYSALYSRTSTIATYKYNALGERLIKTAGTTTTHYHFDQNGHLIAESQGNGTLIREYVWLDDMPLAQIESSGAIYYIHPDHLNTPQKMTDANQALVWDREQQPFGQTASLTYPALAPALSAGAYKQGQFQITVNVPTNSTFTLQSSTNLRTSDWQSLITATGPFTFTDLEAAGYQARFYRAYSIGPPVTQNLRFPGQYFDAESGLNYNMMRDYDNTLGRYIQNDPVGLEGGINLYGYARGNPVNLVDPQGKIIPLLIIGGVEVVEAVEAGEVLFEAEQIANGAELTPFFMSAYSTMSDAVLANLPEALMALQENLYVGAGAAFLAHELHLDIDLPYLSDNLAYMFGTYLPYYINQLGEPGEPPFLGNPPTPERTLGSTPRSSCVTQ